MRFTIGPWMAPALMMISFAVACTEPAPQDAPEVAAAEPRLEVSGPRATLMPGMGAVYLTVANSGGEADRLLRIETEDAAAAELHESVEEDGVMRMIARPEGFEIPAGGTLELAPGGKHAMLVEPKPVEGGGLRLTLHFEESDPLEIEAPAMAMGAMRDQTEHQVGGPM